MLSMHSQATYCHCYYTAVYIVVACVTVGKVWLALAVHKQVTVVQMAE